MSIPSCGVSAPQLWEAVHAAERRRTEAARAMAPPAHWSPPHDGGAPVEFVPLDLHGTGMCPSSYRYVFVSGWLLRKPGSLSWGTGCRRVSAFLQQVASASFARGAPYSKGEHCRLNNSRIKRAAHIAGAKRLSFWPPEAVVAVLAADGLPEAVAQAGLEAS